METRRNMVTLKKKEAFNRENAIIKVNFLLAVYGHEYFHTINSNLNSFLQYDPVKWDSG